MPQASHVLAESGSPSSLPPIVYVGALCCLLVAGVVALVTWLIVRASRRKAAAPSPYPAAVAVHHPRTASPAEVADQLRQIAAFRDSGVLTEDEFQAEKRRILGS